MNTRQPFLQSYFSFPSLQCLTVTLPTNFPYSYASLIIFAHPPTPSYWLILHIFTGVEEVWVWGLAIGFPHRSFVKSLSSHIIWLPALSPTTLLLCSYPYHLSTYILWSHCEDSTRNWWFRGFLGEKRQFFDVLIIFFWSWRSLMAFRVLVWWWQMLVGCLCHSHTWNCPKPWLFEWKRVAFWFFGEFPWTPPILSAFWGP